MNEIRKFGIALAAAVAFVFTVPAILPATAMPAVQTTAQAATVSRMEVEAGPVYKNFDITGDHKADKIQIKTTGYLKEMDAYTGLQVKINGKVAYKTKKYKFGYYYAAGELFTLQNGTSFLYLYASGDDGYGPVCAVLGYDKSTGKLTPQIDFQKMLAPAGYGNGGSIFSVKGNTITTTHNGNSYSLGVSEFRYKWKYSNGKLVMKSNKGKLVEAYGLNGKLNKFKAGRTIKVYSKIGETKASFTIKKGKSVKIDKMYLSKTGKVWLHVTYGKKTGWIIGTNEDSWDYSNPLFSNVMYAG